MKKFIFVIAALFCVNTQASEARNQSYAAFLVNPYGSMSYEDGLWCSLASKSASGAVTSYLSSNKSDALLQATVCVATVSTRAGIELYKMGRNIQATLESESGFKF
jgi:hypothetical protein